MLANAIREKGTCGFEDAGCAFVGGVVSHSRCYVVRVQ